MKYTLFGKTGLRVSELCLGTMSFGPEWGWGADYHTSKQVFDTFAEAGGNFIDTANRYTEGSSEWYIGDFTKEDRDHFVIATKYTLMDKMGDLNFSGNHKKNLHRSLKESLKRLQTDYVDILWLHAWDFTVAPDELMRSLEEVIRSGRVHHIGISDTPAWIVAQCNTLAELRGWSSFAGLQVEYNLLQRTVERELLPMAQAFDMTLTPWAPIAGGALSGKYKSDEQAGRLKPGSARLNERAQLITDKVIEIADSIGVTPAQVAINWTRQRNQKVVPIVGARKIEQIQDSLGATTFELTSQQMIELNEVSAIEMGFPHDFLSGEGVKSIVYGGLKDQLKF